ncbi:Glucoamylase [Neolecta irregularis DAH-3]|uniref:glucan 1,4-alpha-glucosidase n=1 Tax=Neolecta irregularis (strain DAH-3) TaxID=1198029 RepID=A0A1U7LNI5_NEOID|nr:Glucoamylase [Neolecta irregularis DAH-3]|eukprot:OLL24226.1 Glucoamylase [Neolecta irregularis DAH-3]
MLAIFAAALSLLACFPATTLDAWLSVETALASLKIKSNIGTTGGPVDSAAVLASPSTADPDYFYQWIRDSAITYKVIIAQEPAGYNSLVQSWIAEMTKLQHVDNPSGGFDTGGLGEPKHSSTLLPPTFQGDWGRPQADGPALRATAMIQYCQKYLKTDGSSKTYISDTIWPIVKADLHYVATYWKSQSFDLWEEVKGTHFFTMMVQRRALIEGIQFAKDNNDNSSASIFTTIAAEMEDSLYSFWSSSKGYIIATQNSSRSGLDCGTLLGSVHGNGRTGYGLFQPSDEKVLVTLQAFVDSFKHLYNINANANGIACGRYPEDVYDGISKSRGNPWYLCTTIVAESLYTANFEFTKAKSVNVTAANVKFFQQFFDKAEPGRSYSSDSQEFKHIVDGISNYADTFLDVVRQFSARNGSLSEEFDRNTGEPRGARDLTWSYAALISAKMARDGMVLP